jgi:hypothetical protein
MKSTTERLLTGLCLLGLMGCGTETMTEREAVLLQNEASGKVSQASTAPSINRALYYPGSGWVGVSPAPSYLNITGGNLTLEAWIRPTTTPSGNAVIISNEGRYLLAINSSRQIIYALNTASPGWQWVTTTATVPLNTWTHVALTYNKDSANNQVKIWVNGAWVTSGLASGNLGSGGTTSGNTFSVGARQCVTGGCTMGAFFSGYIDQVRVWSHTRNAINISNGMYINMPNDTAHQAILMGEWRANEGTGTTTSNTITSKTGLGIVGGSSGPQWTTTAAPIDEPASSTNPCSLQTESGSDEPFSAAYSMGDTSGSFSFRYETFSVRDRIVVFQGQNQLLDTGCVGTNGTQTRTLNYDASLGTKQVKVEVYPNCAGETGTAWNFTVTCPQ